MITACVPVSWAASIIVSESTDAIDYYDGFGTTELVVGVRAYQWGWEYYYPKDIDLNYNIKNNFNTFVGHSLKYNKTTDINLKFNNLWKFYQNKSLDNIITPAHLIFLPLDNYKLLNFLNFNDIGSTTLNESIAFKKIKMISKINNLNLINLNLSSKYNYIYKMFINDISNYDSAVYGLKRQHNFLNNLAILNNYQTLFNFASFNKLLNFYLIQENFLLKKGHLNLNYFKINNLFSLNLSTFFLLFNTLNNDSDGNIYFYSIFKIINLLNNSNKNNFFKNYVFNKIHLINDQSTLNIHNFLIPKSNYLYKTLNSFSSNQSILTSEKSIKNFVNISSNLSDLNFSNNINSANGYFNNHIKNFNSNIFFFII